MSSHWCNWFVDCVWNSVSWDKNPFICLSWFFFSNSIKLVNLCSIFISTWLTAAGFIHLVWTFIPTLFPLHSFMLIIWKKIIDIQSPRWRERACVPIRVSIPGGKLRWSLGKLSELPAADLLGVCLFADGDDVHCGLRGRVCENDARAPLHGLLHPGWIGKTKINTPIIIALSQWHPRWTQLRFGSCSNPAVPLHLYCVFSHHSHTYTAPDVPSHLNVQQTL